MGFVWVGGGEVGDGGDADDADADAGADGKEADGFVM